MANLWSPHKTNLFFKSLFVIRIDRIYWQLELVRLCRLGGQVNGRIGRIVGDVRKWIRFGFGRPMACLSCTGHVLPFPPSAARNRTCSTFSRRRLSCLSNHSPALPVVTCVRCVHASYLVLRLSPDLVRSLGGGAEEAILGEIFADAELAERADTFLARVVLLRGSFVQR